MNPLSLTQINKTVSGEIHLKDITLNLAPGSRNVILGRTLAGKTSLLRIMAGLDRPTTGQLMVGGEDVTGLSVRKRSVAMVYQQFVNYPSMTVYKNIASPLKIDGGDAKEIDRRVRETAEMLHIDNLLDRLPAELSGGQQQRTAIARALVKDADLLLLDEPLVNLDYKLREDLRIELQDIFSQRKSIVVYTTTEPSEALMIGGDIVVMDEGRVLQTGHTPDVYRHPASMRVAEVFSDPPFNFIEGEIRKEKKRLGKDIEIPVSDHLKGVPAGNCTFGIRPNHLSLSRSSEEDIEIKAHVSLAEINGSETFIHMSYEDASLVVQEQGVYTYKIGSPVSAFVHPDRLYVFDAAGRLTAAAAGRN